MLAQISPWPKASAFPECFQAPLLILALAFFPAASECHATTTNQFNRLVSYSTGGAPSRIVAADFNRDGKQDIVALDSNDVLSFLAGSGSGFAAPQTIATLPSSTAIPLMLMVAGDFNGDGNPDILLLPSPGTAVEVFLGHGNGTFAAPVTISDGLPSAGALVVGDFNNDGKLDVAIAGSTSIALLLSNGSGIFAKPVVTATSLTASSGSLAITVGDVNRDSHLDIAATDGNNNLQILLGSSTGALHPQAVANLNLLFQPNVIAIADFNGDGKPDLATVAGVNLPQFQYPRLCFFNGNGDGTFAASSQPCLYVPLDSVTEMLVTNLNGKPGITFPGDPLMLFLNNGTGVFSLTDYAVGGPLALADFNGDGRQDVVSCTATGVQLILNTGAGVMRAPLSLLQAGGPYTFTVAMNVTDMNRDGYADLVLNNDMDEHGYLLPQTNVLLGSSRNRFISAGNYGFPDGLFSRANPPAIGDFNHDGLLDVAASGVTDFNQGTPEAQILFGDGKGNFGSTGPVFPLATNFLAAGNFNAGSSSDLASLDDSGLQILLGNGNGTFASPVNYAAGSTPAFVLQRDLNGDGKTDLVVVNHDSDTISILLGNGDGTFKPQVTYAAGTLPNTAVTGDFNRDGKIDIAVGGKTGVSVLFGNGNGTFQAQKIYTATGPVTGIAAAALRQDGILSLLTVDSATHRFVLLPGNGDGTFGTAVGYPVNQAPIAILSGDFDRDGAPDVVLINEHLGTDTFTGEPIGGSLDVYYNQGGDHVTLTASSTKPAANQLVTLTARVTLSPGELGTPSGQITFKDGTRLLGTVTMSGGKASLSTAFAAGTHTILAQYSGDANFNPNRSSTVTIVAGP